MAVPLLNPEAIGFGFHIKVYSCCYVGVKCQDLGKLVIYLRIVFQQIRI